MGGEFDALDTALINASKAGIFVSMSNGNAGPGLGTGDHPSSDYINVAASSTTGTYASGRFNIIAPEPISSTLMNIPFTTADFGSPLPVGEVITHTYLAAANVNAANTEGCSAWPADTFTGHAAVISRGSCEFGLKVLNAEQAGADFVVIYNNAGDGLTNMGAGLVGSQVTIPSIFVGQTAGTAIVAKATEAIGLSVDAVLEVSTLAYQAGNVPDIVANFSSRGPGVGNVLKPDITAPGVNIMAQGFAPNATGEARHLGYGQASGTSMAAPHVTGAAALLRALHPDWSNASIKSALMSTSKYLGIYNADITPAQPLDMGAGRLDLIHAADPGVILDPPSLSFGLVMTGTAKTLTFTVKSITDTTETYELSTLYTGGGFDSLTTLPGFTVEPISITLAPGASTIVSVTFDTASGMGIGDNQGFIVLDGDVHDAHAPAWARTTAAPAAADVLIIGSDFSYLLGYDDYLSYYTDALDALGMTYDFWNADWYFANPTTIPSASELAAYDAILLFTGDHYQPDGTFTVSTPFTSLDMDILTEYANAGGKIFDGTGSLRRAWLRRLRRGHVLLQRRARRNWLQDSVTGFGAPDRRIVARDGAPKDFNVDVDISIPTLDEFVLAGFNEVPPVATTASGTVDYGYNKTTGTFEYMVEISVNDPVSITAAGIYSGSVGTNGPVLALTFPFTETQLVTGYAKLAREV